jgi:outer membrane protein TolC
MRKIIIHLILLIFPLTIFGQSLTLDSCQVKGRNNYPLLKQYGLIEKTADYNIKNANIGYLPQLSISAKATYQSEVTKLPITIPGVVIPELTPDQYQATLEVTQLIWDGGVTLAQKQNIKANADAEKQKLEVDLYALRDRINQLYFGILLLDGQLEQNKILQEELKNNLDKIKSLVKNGLATLADLDAVKVEQLNAIQRETELKSTRKSFVQMLSAFIGTEITENTILERPIMKNVNNNPEVKRPELLLLDAQNKILDTQKNILTTSNLPKIGAFIQGGYGKPGLNMLTNEFSAFYIGGLRLSWNISGFYTQKNNLLKIETGKKNIEVQKETFLFNNSLLTKQQLNEIEKLKSTINTDDEIIGLKNNIKKTTESKLQNGTATVTDLLRDINSESIAKQTRILHEIQLYSTYYQYLNNTNN